MTEVESPHTEFADDSSLWRSGPNITEVAENLNLDIDKVANEWCSKWNMGIAADKTEVLIIKPTEDYVVDTNKIKLKGKDLKVVAAKKVLGIVLDENLNFREHINDRTKSGYKALRSITHFGNEKRGCNQDIFLSLYKSLVLPVIDYGSSVVATATEYAEKQFSSIQRKALLTATGCMSSTATDQLEVLTGILPMALHLKCKNAEELVRTYSKVEGNKIKTDMQDWLENQEKSGKTMYRYQMSHFNEVKGKIDLEYVEEDFKYTKEGGQSLCRRVNYVSNTEEHQKSKDMQVHDIEEVLQGLKDSDICMFTDGSALNNPGPTGAGACIYFKGINSDPIQLKRPISPSSNNYVGELNGIHLALSLLQEKDPRNKVIHLFVDCQPAIKAVFSKTIPDTNIALIIETRQIIHSLEKKENLINIHWTPGHRNVKGNELADKLAKEAAQEMIGKPLDVEQRKKDKKEVSKIIRNNAKDKWQRRYENTSKNETFTEIFPTVDRAKKKQTDRHMEVLTNQLITGHSRLNSHMAKIDQNVQEQCNYCGEVETTRHFVFDCTEYRHQRNIMEREIEEILSRGDIQSKTDISLKVLTGNSEDNQETRNKILEIFQKYLRDTGRFSQ